MSKKTGKKGRDGVLSIVIDPLLFEGGRTVSEISDIVTAHFNNAFSKEKVINNVRSRIFALQKTGYRLDKDSARKVRLILKEVVTQTSAITENLTIINN